MRLLSKSLVISGLALLAVASIGSETWAACGCKVTSASGSSSLAGSDCTIVRVVAFESATCPTITVDASVSGTITLEAGIPLTKGVTLEGPVGADGKPTVTLAYGPKMTSPMLMTLIDGAKVSNFNLTAPGKVVIQSLLGTSANSIENVNISNAKTGIDHHGNGLIVTGGSIHDTETGVVVEKAGTLLLMAGDVEIYNNTVGAQLSGDTNLVIGSKFHDNATAVNVDGQKNTISNATFTGNKTAAIALINGGNAASATVNPKVIAVLTDTTDASKFALVVEAPQVVSVIHAYISDGSVSVPQGKTYLGAATAFKSNNTLLANGNKLFVVEAAGQSPAQLITLLAFTDSGVSAFSPVQDLNAVQKQSSTAAFKCGETEWFMTELVKELESGKSVDVWLGKSDDDWMKNDEEDLNRNCVVDTFEGVQETDPAKTDYVKFLPIPNICALYPFICFGNLNLTPLDFDKDGVPDSQDKCPIVANADQLDTDKDGIGDACDPDMDNDGLSSLYCDPSYTLDGKDHSAEKSGVGCTSGVDQELVVNSIKDPNSGSFTLDPKNADSDNDGYCDGPGWGPIAHPCKPMDNCPRKSNTSQIDNDEDGVGDSCDKSVFEAKALVDSDADGALDWQANGSGDNCPWIANKDQVDTDGDGRGDACDSDDDNDGVLDVVENSTRFIVTDKSNNNVLAVVMMNPVLPNSEVEIATDLDSQGKLIVKSISPSSDAICDGAGSGFKNDKVDMSCKSSTIDACPILSGGVGTCDSIVLTNGLAVKLDDMSKDAACPYHHFNAVAAQFGWKKSDGTIVDIACDSDLDGDNVLNVKEDGQKTHYWEADSDHYKPTTNNPGSFNSDKVTDDVDTCPTNFNPKDFSGTQPDVCNAQKGAADADKDTIQDSKDNCLNVANPDQADLDKDSVGDACDEDTDGDGVTNDADKCPLVSDPSNTCSATPGGNEPPPAGPTPGIDPSNMQGGGGCSMVPGAATSSSEMLMALMAFAPLLAMRLRRKA